MIWIDYSIPVAIFNWQYDNNGMHIFFSGIGGVGIGPLAMLAQDMGYRVSGSDLSESNMTRILSERGINIGYGQDEAYISSVDQVEPIDWMIHSSAISEDGDHQEMAFAKKKSIKTSKRGPFINTLISEGGMELLAVSGTHGKTSTTAMIVWALKKLGVPASYSIGSNISFGPPAQHQPNSKIFVLECDEFDRNFLDYHPEYNVVVSLDYDHPDTYPTRNDYLAAFKQFIGQCEHTFIWQKDYDNLGLNENHNIMVLDKDDALPDINLIGQHNRLNASIAARQIKQLLPEQDMSKITAVLSEYPGSGRRLEKLRNNLLSDYAHHPTEIAASLQALSEVSSKIVVIYQPHQNIRQNEILSTGGYDDCMSLAEKIYWLPTFLSREDPGLKVIFQEELAKTLSNSQVVEMADMNQELLDKISDDLNSGYTVVIMSAGNLDPWLRGNLDKI